MSEAPCFPANSVGDRPVMHILPVGRYAWCTCGKSGTMPFCDHPPADPEAVEPASPADPEAGPGGAVGDPVEVRASCAPHWFRVTRQQLYAVCNCRITNHPPFCDFRHRLIQAAKRKKQQRAD